MLEQNWTTYHSRIFPIPIRCVVKITFTAVGPASIYTYTAETCPKIKRLWDGEWIEMFGVCRSHIISSEGNLLPTCVRVKLNQTSTLFMVHTVLGVFNEVRRIGRRFEVSEDVFHTICFSLTTPEYFLFYWRIHWKIRYRALGWAIAEDMVWNFRVA